MAAMERRIFGLEQLLVSAEQRLRDEGIRGVIYLFKNNTDSAGNSYGCHENYWCMRASHRGTPPTATTEATASLFMDHSSAQRPPRYSTRPFRPR